MSNGVSTIAPFIGYRRTLVLPGQIPRKGNFQPTEEYFFVECTGPVSTHEVQIRAAERKKPRSKHVFYRGPYQWCSQPRGRKYWATVAFA